MNRSELIAAVADNLDITKVHAEQVVLSVLDTITAELAAGNRVELHAFGTFEQKVSKSRMGHNPRTGDPVHIAAKKSVKFKASTTLNKQL